MQPRPNATAPQLSLPLAPHATPQAAFERVFRRMGLNRPAPEFQIEFLAFAGLRSTIRLRGNTAQVRVSDVLAAAPPVVMEALAEILVAQVYRRRPSVEARECYLSYAYSPVVRRKIDKARRRRGRLRLLSPRGRWFDLEEIFSRLNRRFFRGRLSPPRLGWSSKPLSSLLGHYDSSHRAIMVNRSLDSPWVPREVIEYLVFHEMLHIRYPVERQGHRRVVHSRQFRKSERQFPEYRRALRWLKLHSLAGAR